MREDASGISIPFFTLYVIFFAFSMGLLWEMRRTDEILTMVEKLEDLNEEFFRYFTVAEVLSMYELLRFAPDIIWKEYSSLSPDEITESTSEKYRRIAEPFRHRQTVGHNRAVVTLTILGLVIAAMGVSAAIWSAVG